MVRGVDSAAGHVTSLLVEEQLILGETLRPGRGARDVLPSKGGLVFKRNQKRQTQEVAAIFLLNAHPLSHLFSQYPATMTRPHDISLNYWPC